MIMTRLTAWPVWVVLLALLGGCADLQMVPTADETATTAAGYGRAFGRIVFIEDGKPRQWDTGTFAVEILGLHVLSQQTGRMHRMEIRGDGRFLWPLPAGDYTIVSWHTGRPPRSGRIWSGFSIAQPGQAVYIGDLHIRQEQGRFDLALEDHYAEALAAAQPRLSGGAFTPLPGMMRLEERLGQYQRMLGICAASWGLACGNRLAGVEPLQPAGATEGYPVTVSLTPLLEWTPSTRAGILYDVAIHESLTLGLDMPGMPRARGALVEYAEALSEPRFQLRQPLKAGRKYDWSVRLRDGDTVSSWSTSGYFTFFIVGWASGSGLWFGLSTPQR